MAADPLPTPINTRRILADGLWFNNPGLAQLLGLCPLLAVSRTLVTGLALGIASVLVLCASNLLISLLRRYLDPRVRLPAMVLIIAGLVTAVDLVFKAHWFDLYAQVGLFVALIVTNCVILARAEGFASRHGPGYALIDGLAHGLGFLLVLGGLGALRELLGYGTLFSGAEQLFGPAAAGFELVILPERQGLLIATLPPGAFLLLGCLVAFRQYWLGRKRS